jgi:hypothetical protein
MLYPGTSPGPKREKFYTLSHVSASLTFWEEMVRMSKQNCVEKSEPVLLEAKFDLLAQEVGRFRWSTVDEVQHFASYNEIDALWLDLCAVYSSGFDSTTTFVFFPT